MCTNNLNLTGNKQVTVTATIPFSKRYLKYLTKKFLKKQTLSEFLHPVATTKDGFLIKYYNIACVCSRLVSSSARTDDIGVGTLTRRRTTTSKLVLVPSSGFVC